MCYFLTMSTFPLFHLPIPPKSEIIWQMAFRQVIRSNKIARDYTDKVNILSVLHRKLQIKIPDCTVIYKDRINASISVFIQHIKIIITKIKL